MTVSPTVPGPTVGVIGGGQLGRMLAEAASPLGVDVIVLDPTPECPAARVATDQIVADFDDVAAVESLAERSDVLTLEIELADPAALEAAPAPVEPAPQTLAMIRDKLTQADHFAEAGIPHPAYQRVDDADDLAAALDTLGSPVMLKARTGGYDGRGNVPVAASDDLDAAIEAIGGPALAEEFVDFERELAVMVANGVDERTTHAVTETIQEDEILHRSVSPARCDDSVGERAIEVAVAVCDALEGRGIYGVELFETRDGDVLLNEVAPRPHNSGHWTIEGAHTSQFEQHLRAVLGWPLGTTAMRADVVATGNLLGDEGPTRPAQLEDVTPVLARERAHLHWYGKAELRPLRKLGHLTLTADGVPPDRVLASVEQLQSSIRFTD